MSQSGIINGQVQEVSDNEYDLLNPHCMYHNLKLNVVVIQNLEDQISKIVYKNKRIFMSNEL